jgi:hypothetical protein
MLPNVWSVDVFKKESGKLFSSRSLELQAIDRALARAHSLDPATDAGTNAIIELLEAIAAWRRSKIAQGKQSGRGRAINQLQAQLSTAAEGIYRRKITEQKVVDSAIAAARAAVKQDLGTVGLRQGKGTPPLPQRSGFPNHPVSPIPTVKLPIPPSSVLPPQPIATGPTSAPQRNAAQDRLFNYLAQALIDQRQKVMAYDDEDLFDDLDIQQKGRLAARWMLCVPDEVKDVAAARAEALRVLAAMLGNDVSVIKSLLENNLEVVVIPRDKGMTVLEQFESIRGMNTFDGRSWDSVRGVGNVTDPTPRAVRDSRRGPGSVVAIDPGKGRIYTAVTEENLLGGLTTAPGGGCYATGYSTTTHEFAHSVHMYGLTDADRATLDRGYKLRLQQGDNAEWVDGPRRVGANQCYASMTIQEYFAQLSNAWLGVNFGSDPYTGKPRNNGKQWVLDHEPKMVSDILERVYGKRVLEDLNPAVILKS